MLEYRLTNVKSDHYGCAKLEVYLDGVGLPIAFLPVRSILGVVSASDVQTQMRAFEEIYLGERS
jgi:hypothetical protein